jgi:hypothetical protein
MNFFSTNGQYCEQEENRDQWPRDIVHRKV